MVTSSTREVELSGVGRSTSASIRPAPFIAWAASAHINMVSFWALQRDNGSCPGVKGSNDCSGVVQNAWAFSRAFAAFNSRRF